MSLDGDAIASAYIASMRNLLAAMPNAWIRSAAGAHAAVSGVALPTLNGVLAEDVDPDANVIAELLSQVAATGLPHCLQLRPGASGALADLALARGMVWVEQVPLMVLEDTSAIEAAQQVEGFLIRELTPEEVALHVAVASSGFDAPSELFSEFMTPAVLRVPGVRCYVGEVDGQPVTTGLGATHGAFVGIFNIATPPEHRGRGYGAAITARAVDDGLTAGALWSFLQSSAAGHSIYERLGFRTVECWDCWFSAP